MESKCPSRSEIIAMFGVFEYSFSGDIEYDTEIKEISKD